MTPPKEPACPPVSLRRGGAESGENASGAKGSGTDYFKYIEGGPKKKTSKKKASTKRSSRSRRRRTGPDEIAEDDYLLRVVNFLTLLDARDQGQL